MGDSIQTHTAGRGVSVNKKKRMTGRPLHFRLAKSDQSFVQGKYVFVLFITLLLSFGDGILTIFLLRMGAWEANPVMRFTLSISYEFFFLTKLILTMGGLFILTNRSKMRIFGGLFSLEEITAAIILFYEGLIIYEIALLHLI